MRIFATAFALVAVQALCLATPAMASDPNETITLYSGPNFTGSVQEIAPVNTSCVRLDAVVESAKNISTRSVHFFTKSDCSGSEYVLGSLHGGNVPDGFASYVVTDPS